MEIIINSKYGGYGLSPLATMELAKKKGKECYFFEYNFKDKIYIPLTIEQAETTFLWHAYSVPNPQDYKLHDSDPNGLFISANKRAEKIAINDCSDNRTDSDLVAVVKKLGKLANGPYADLEIVEIPDEVDYEIAEYDGLEHIAESHRKWY